MKPTAGEDDLVASVINAKLMQKLLTEFPERLVSDTKQTLVLVNEVLDDYEAESLRRTPNSKTPSFANISNIVTREHDVDEEESERDEVVGVAFSLLNLVFTSSTFKTTPQTADIIGSIRLKLVSMSAAKTTHVVSSELRSTARNIVLLLDFRISESEADARVLPGDPYEEDRKMQKLALSYLTSTDSPPPVRVHGLSLVNSLIKNDSPVIDVPSTLILLTSFLRDSEEYIFLSAITTLALLSSKHPRIVMEGLLQQYVDIDEEQTLDARLRLGEALLRTIEKAHETFADKLAKNVCEGLLSVAGRRGYKPKTEIAKEKRDRLKKGKNTEAEEAWDGPVPQFDDIPADEIAGNEILEKILEGWEGKKGAEDVRIRASSLSIFGTAVETNLSGIGSTLISSGVDLAMNILTLETAVEHAILRRAAILLIMSLVRALDTAREKGVKLAFGFAPENIEDIVRVLKYVEGTDVDGLVTQHARDVITGLETWQANNLMAAVTLGRRDGDLGTELSRLAGLSIDPDTERVGRRPRIEEID